MKKFCYLAIGLICIAATIGAAASTQLRYSFTGIIGDPATNVTNTLKDLHGKLIYPLTQSKINSFFREAPTQIKKSLQPYGYFYAKVESHIQQSGNVWTTTFKITPGPAMPVSHIEIKILGAGAHDSGFMSVLDTIPLKTGNALNIPNYESTKQLLFQRASERGYFKARMVKSHITVNFNTYSASIVIIFNTGPRFKFGKTTFSKSPFHDSFLKRFLRFHEGENYKYKKVQKTQQNMTNSNYFRQVIITPEPQHATDDIIPITVHVIPRKKLQFVVGAGYGTDTGIRGTLGLTLRRLNGYGHRFRALLHASKINSNLTASYIIPGPNPATDEFALTGGFADIDQTSGRSKSAKVALSYTTRIWKIQQLIALTYLNERYNIRNLPKTNAQLLYPSIDWQLLLVNHIPRTTAGIRFNLSIAGTSDDLAFRTKNGFFQTRMSLKTLFTLPTDTRVLLRAELARTNIKNLNNLPLSLQLFAGGALSIRGYSFNSIGPGRNLFVASAELQQHIYSNFYLAGFVDAGNVTNSDPFQPDKLNIGVGPAIVFLSPIGAIEVSLANSVSSPKPEWRIQFSMGPVL